MRGKLPRENGDVLRMGAERLTKIVVNALSLIIDLELVDQSFGFLVFVQKLERTGEINAGQVILPFIGVFFVEIIAQIEYVIGRDDAFAREDIDRIGDAARIN